MNVSGPSNMALVLLSPNTQHGVVRNIAIERNDMLDCYRPLETNRFVAQLLNSHIHTILHNRCVSRWLVGCWPAAAGGLGHARARGTGSTSPRAAGSPPQTSDSEARSAWTRAIFKCVMQIYSN